MPSYKIFQQLPPIVERTFTTPDGRRINLWAPRLAEVGTIQARSGSHAIDLAKALPAFRYASRTTLAAFPIVQRVRTRQEEVEDQYDHA